MYVIIGLLSIFTLFTIILSYQIYYLINKLNYYYDLAIRVSDLFIDNFDKSVKNMN